MKELTIWQTYHEESLIEKYHLQENGIIRLFNSSNLQIEGQHINHLNPFYSELVTMYWVWKNQVKSERVGFCHYRRVFSGILNIAPRQCQVMAINRNFPVAQHYKSSHNYQDYNDAIEILDAQYGLGNKYSMYLLEGRIFIPFCCFIMHWEDFDQLCNFLFATLGSYDQMHHLDMMPERYLEKIKRDFRYDNVDYQRRAISFLAERLISCFIVCEMKPFCVSTL